MAPASILITEDEQLVAEDLRQTLQEFGYRVPGIATTGEDAVRLAEQLHPDLVLMDIYLAGTMTGIDAAEQIRQRLDVPVIFLTAYSDRKIVEDARLTRPYGYVLKPFNERELHTAIEITLDRHALDRRLKESEERYRLFAENFLGIAFRLAPDLSPVFYHGSVAAITGYAPEDLMAGTPRFDDLVHPDDRDAVNAHMEQVRSVAGHTAEFRFRIFARDKSLHWLHALVRNVAATDRRPLFVQGAMYDITGRVTAEEELRALNEHLEDLVDRRTREIKSANRALGHKNRAIEITTAPTRALIYTDNEQDLATMTVRIITAIRAYACLAIISLDEAGHPVAVAGEGEACLPHTEMAQKGSLPPCMAQVLNHDHVLSLDCTDAICSGCPQAAHRKDVRMLVTRLQGPGNTTQGCMVAGLPDDTMQEDAELVLFRQLATEVSFALGYLRGKERQRVAFDQITKNLEQLATLNDQIRNPLQGIVGYASMHENMTCTKIIDLSRKIDQIIDRLDEGYLESKKVRDFMERHAHIVQRGDTDKGSRREGKRGADD